MPEPLHKDTFKEALGGIASLGAGERLTLSGLTGASKAYFLAKTLCSGTRPVFVIMAEAEEAEEFINDAAFFLGKKEECAFFYPPTELLPFETQAPHPEISAKRAAFLFNLISSKKPYLAASGIETILELIPPKESFKERILNVSVGKEYEREKLFSLLCGMGYSAVSMVEERGEMSSRGGIMDIFPPLLKYPVRIEFFGDEVESIRTFDPSTQRSQKELASALILPAGQTDLSHAARKTAKEKLLERAEERGVERSVWEPLYNKISEAVALKEADSPPLKALFYKKLSAVFDYLPQDSIITIVDPSRVELKAVEFLSGVDERARDKMPFYAKPGELYLTKKDVELNLKRYPVIVIEPFKSEGVLIKTESNMDVRQDIAIKKDLSPLKERLRRWSENGVSAYITAHNMAQAERMKELLDEFPASIIPSAEVLEGERRLTVKIAEGVLSSGFTIPSEFVTVVTEEEVFGERVKRKAPPSKKTDSFLLELKDLGEGDFVVHSLHGIGIYRGLKRVVTDGVESDFLLLEYRSGDRLYLPVGRMDLINKYHGMEGRTPEPDKLGSGGWEKKKGRVKAAVEQIAGELIKLYAERAAARGHSFSGGGKLFTEFEAGFEYEETPDQARAIDEVMKDMSDVKPMDRLICGDVGYGKTEVAMRAAFRAVLDNKQAVVLVPTTILAQQHFLTFQKRFAPFPVKTDVLSRFKSRKEQIETLKLLAEGKIDIIIGTHRLLQEDVEFKDLGLIVVDEEHRFGVRHKERLKGLKKGVDVLTLTATPIPRTLNMAMTGIRDLSIINTPPQDRLAIITRVIRFDEVRIKEAIERELKRGGQVFFVHNRVLDIASMHERLKSMLSGVKEDIRIAVAHGQMREAELEKIMLGFVKGESDILLTTTIIESGLDIPTANTIIINRADRFGLSELYQLRGRVGRSSHRAYAYLISPEEDSLTHDAKKRIEVAKELSELGSGFRIAAYDLEIRGAGEILGKSQSGHIAEVGFDMYTTLLEEAVREVKGEAVEREVEPEVNLKISLYIPENYIPDTRQRIGVYKRLSSAANYDELTALKEELTDRYGELPGLVEDVFSAAELKCLLKTLGARELSQKGARLYLSLSKITHEKCPGAVARAIRLSEKEPKRFKLTPEGKFVYLMADGSSPLKESRYLLKELASR